MTDINWYLNREMLLTILLFFYALSGWTVSEPYAEWNTTIVIAYIFGILSEVVDTKAYERNYVSISSKFLCQPGLIKYSVAIVAEKQFLLQLA